MKKILLLVIVLASGFFLWQKFKDNATTLKPLYAEPYIVVYGRDSCRWTGEYLKNLRRMGYACTYKSVDRKDVCDELHPRMQKAGLDVGYYLLPVIDVNANLLIRPELETVLSKFRE